MSGVSAASGPHALADARARLTNALEIVVTKAASRDTSAAVRSDIDGSRRIEWPASVTFTTSARQRADGSLRRSAFFASPTTPKPVTRWRVIVARIMLAYAPLYAIGGVVYHLRDLPAHEVAAFAIAMRALVRLAQNREYGRHVGRLQLSKRPDATMTLDLDDSGLRTSGFTNATYAWDEIASIDYYEGYFRVNVPRCETLVIPGSAFADCGVRFAEAVEAKFLSTYLLRKPSQGTSVLVNAYFRKGPS